MSNYLWNVLRFPYNSKWNCFVKYEECSTGSLIIIIIIFVFQLGLWLRHTSLVAKYSTHWALYLLITNLLQLGSGNDCYSCFLNKYLSKALSAWFKCFLFTSTLIISSWCFPATFVYLETYQWKFVIMEINMDYLFAAYPAFLTFSSLFIL